MKAIIPAAGLGTRFLPATKSVPKEMLPILDKPVIQYVVEEALDAPGCDSCVIVSSPGKPLIEQYFSPHKDYEDMLRSRGKEAYADACAHAGSLDVSYVYQTDPKGLGDAVLCCAEQTGQEPFYVLLGDVIVPGHQVLRQMKAISDAHDGASVLAVTAVADQDVSRFGIIGGNYLGQVEAFEGGPSSEAACATGADGGADSQSQDQDQDQAHAQDQDQDAATRPGAVWKISSMIEKPALEDAPSNLAIFGRYLLSAHVMELLATQEPGKGNEVQLTDTLLRCLTDEPMYALVIDPASGHDTGTIATYVATSLRMALADPRFAGAVRAELDGTLR